MLDKAVETVPCSWRPKPDPLNPMSEQQTEQGVSQFMHGSAEDRRDPKEQSRAAPDEVGKRAREQVHRKSAEQNGSKGQKDRLEII